jgi:hypothetical protein
VFLIVDFGPLLHVHGTEGAPVEEQMRQTLAAMKAGGIELVCALFPISGSITLMRFFPLEIDWDYIQGPYSDTISGGILSSKGDDEGMYLQT